MGLSAGNDRPSNSKPIIQLKRTDGGSSSFGPSTGLFFYMRHCEPDIVCIIRVAAVMRTRPIEAAHDTKLESIE